jgi:WD40 repeat protein/transcriptional regulator with XRE-family HTH domain
MGSRRHYKPRDFGFAQQLFLLRKRAGLTQDNLALKIGVGEKTVRNWESGANYPTDVHMRKLIELYLNFRAFAPEHEEEEIRALWKQLGEKTRHQNLFFDEQWLATLLKTWREHYSSQASRQLQPPEQTVIQRVLSLDTVSRPLRGGWGAALDVSAIYGRTEELKRIEHWILMDRCRLVALLGMGGIGKTSLAARLVQQVAERFDCVLWCSLHNAPSVEELLRDWLPVLASPQDIQPVLEEGEHLVYLLMRFLQQRRCLLVLDNLETLFQEGVLEGRYRVGYEGYATLIQGIAQTVHQSCLLLTCREKFPDLGILSGRQAAVREFHLTGLPVPVSQQLLRDKGLFGTQDAWRDLVQRYAGNPLALKMVGETVRALFGGEIDTFLARGIITFQGIRQLLSKQFERLSVLEKALIYWLAIVREAISLEELCRKLLPTTAEGQIMEALHALRSRSLVERGEQGAVFLLQPVILEYINEQLIIQVCKEIEECRPELLLTHLLYQAQANDALRASQTRLILQPILDRLLSQFGTAADLEARLETLIQQLRTLPRFKQGYGGGNIVNLLIRLNGHVKGKDCSQLAIWQAGMQEAEAQDTNFTGADLAGSTFLEPMDNVTSVALDTNGQHIAAGVGNGEIRLWQVRDGQLLWALLGHDRFAWSLTFNPEGTHLISGGYDGLVKVWEVSSGQCLNVLEGHTAWVRSVAIHPDGRLLATCSHDGSMRLWDLVTGDCLKIWHEPGMAIWSVAFSPNAQFLAFGFADGIVKVWDLANQQLLWSSSPPYGLSAATLAFSPDGEILVSGGSDGIIRLWGANTGVHLGTLSGHTDTVFSLAFNAQGLLASCSGDTTVKLWQVGSRGEDGRCLDTLQGHTNTVWKVSFGPNDLLASGGQEGMVKLWGISKDEGGRCLRTLHGYSRVINSLLFSPDGHLLVSGESNGTVKMWETQSGQCLHILSKQAGRSFAQAFSLDGNFLVKSFPDKTMKLWDVTRRHWLRTFKGHQGEIWTLILSPDGRYLASGSFDKTVKLWATSDGHCLTTFQGHHTWVWSLAFSCDGKLLASGDIHGVVKLWEMSSGRCLHTFLGSARAIVALKFTPDGTRLLSSNEQDLVTVWNVESGERLKGVPGVGDTYWQDSVVFSTDGNFVVARSHDQTVKLWEVNSGALLHSFSCPADRPWSVAWSMDQQLLACGTDEGSIWLWQRQTGKCLMTLRSDRPYERMNISGATGISEVQRTSLKILGAVEQS